MKYPTLIRTFGYKFECGLLREVIFNGRVSEKSISLSRNGLIPLAKMSSKFSRLPFFLDFFSASFLAFASISLEINVLLLLYSEFRRLTSRLEDCSLGKFFLN